MAMGCYNSGMGKQCKKLRIVTIVGVFVAAGGLAFLVATLVGRTGRFSAPGKVIFAETMTDADKNFVGELPEEVKLKADVTISAQSDTIAPTGDDSIIYDILLPVTDFYDEKMNISASDLDQVELISFSELDFTKKLLAVDDNYFLDTLDSGAIFKYYTFSSEDPESRQTVIDLVKAKIESPSRDKILTFAQTGVTALSRGMTRRLQQTGDAQSFASNIAEYLSGFDLTHTSNEASFSDRASAQNICADPRMVDVLVTIGLDIVELTGNHNQDCGDEDAALTIDRYRELEMRTVGGGKTADEAAIPLEIEEKGTGITLLAYNLSTGGYTTDATPGANFYTEERATADIEAAKARGDLVIVDIQYYECSAYASTTEDTTCDYADSAAGDQVGFFRHLIDLGADVVVGTSAHQPQTFELYGDGVIYYGLGNLFFDQSRWPGTTRSLILVHYFDKGKLLQTRLVPTVYDDTYQTKLMSTGEAEAFIGRLVAARPGK